MCVLSDAARGAAFQQQVIPIDLELALDVMETGVVVQDAELRIRWVNPHAAHLLGAPASELVDLTSLHPRWDAVHVDGTPYPGETHPAVLAVRAGEPVRGALMGVARPRSADRVWLEVSSVPTKGPEGRVVGVVTTLHETTAPRHELEKTNAHLGRLVEERTRELAALLRTHRESEELHRAVIRSMAEGVVVHEPNGAIRDANPAAERILGLTLEQLQGRHPVDPQWGLTTPDDRPLPPEQIPSEVTRRTGEPVRECILKVRGADGAVRWLSVNTDPVHIEGEETSLGVVATFNDITEERRMEQGLRVAQRQEALGVLAGGIAHNFNNMLAVILPSLELASELGGPAVDEALLDARRATRGATSLVRQLLRLARREGSEALEEIDLERTLDDVVALAQRIFSRRIDLQLDRSGAPLPIMGRRDELEQVIFNLLINARDAVEGCGDPRIQVRTRAESGDAVVEIRDNGMGMTDDVARRLGQPFFTTKEPGHGTGLGLATALGIVSDLDGRLEWRSPGPDEGSTFTLAIPLVESAEVPEPAPAGPPSPPTEAVQGARVLVVDDEPMILKSVSRLLGKLVPEILTAGDGEEALALVDAGERFDAVLVDFSMPGMDGGELTRSLKERRPELPVFIMSGFVRDPDQVADADGVIPKPFSGKELRSTLRPWLVGRAGGR